MLSSFSPSYFLHPPFLSASLLQTNPTCSSLISTIAGSGVANSAEIMGCWKTKARWFKGFKMCWRATRKLACQSEKNFSPCRTFFFHFLWKIRPWLLGSGWVCFLWQLQVSRAAHFSKRKTEFSSGATASPRALNQEL